MSTPETSTPSTATECWWCEDGPPDWEACERYTNADPGIDYLWEAMQRLWVDYSQAVCPRTKMRHVPQGTPYPGFIDP